LFVVVNFIHSAIDGASVSLDSKTSILAVGLHEIVRQYILYVTTIRLFKNKNIKPIWVSVFIIVLVTGVWVLGSFVGYWLRSNINIYSSYAYIADLFIWIFVGDIFHHWKEEYKKTQSNKHCCH
jgi:zinc transporter ZupT